MPQTTKLTVVVALHDHGSPAEVGDGLAAQTVARERWELLVVAPENREDWRGAVTALADDGVRARYLESPLAAGRAGALNRGVREAEGEIVVFLADDIAPEPDFLAEHLAVSRGRPPATR